MGWDAKYRPQRFSDVRGQGHAVRLISELARRRAGRSLLLRGAVGSGKTSLARISAKAFNCESIDVFGSPCNRCPTCLEPSGYLFEFDVAGASGDKARVDYWLQSHYRSPMDHRARVLFFDEAHALPQIVQDALLKRIEEPEPGVFFCLATTDVRDLKPALKSRLMDVRLEALKIADAIELLESVARNERLSYDRDAFYLLAAAKPPYARDLVLALEQLAGLSDHIDATLVKNVFDLDARDSLEKYSIALAEGDRGSQTNAINEWNDGIGDKIVWIEKFLTTAYYNDVLGQSIVIDPLVHSLSSARRKVVSGLCNRLTTTGNPSDLAPYFEKMLEFWVRPRSEDEAALFLRLSLFERLVNTGLQMSVVARPQRAGARIHGADRPSREQPRGHETQPSSSFIERRDVRAIINRASFLAQHHGSYLNVGFKIESSSIPTEEGLAVAGIKSFSRDLYDFCNGDTDGFASITLIEREGMVVVGRVVAHVEQFEHLADFAERLNTWCRDWAMSNHCDVDISVRANEEPDRFHWKVILDLCAGFCDAENYSSSDTDLRKWLKIRKSEWRNPGPLDSSLLIFSGLLCSPAIESGCKNSMDPLSAFDAEQWDYITSGWEEKEFRDRQEEIDRRAQELEELTNRYRADGERLERELAELRGHWSVVKPEQRPRSWRGWW